MSIKVTFPDGAARDYTRGTTGTTVVEGISKSLAKKTVAKKTVTKKKVAAAPAQTGVEAVAIASTTSAAIDPDTRAQMVAEAAYYRAQKRGFEGGQEQEDWYEGEREIEELLKDKD